MYKLHTCVKEFSPLSSSSLGRRRRRRKTSFLFPGGDRRKEKNLKKGGWKKAVVVVPYANEKEASSCSNCCAPNKNMSLTRKIGHFMGETEIILGSELGRDRPLLPSWSSCTAEHAVSHKRILLIPLPFSFVLPPFPFSVFPAQLHSRNTNQLRKERKKERVHWRTGKKGVGFSNN